MCSLNEHVEYQNWWDLQPRKKGMYNEMEINYTFPTHHASSFSSYYVFSPPNL